MIIRFAIALVIFYLAYRVGKYILRLPSENSRDFSGSRGEIDGEDLVRDPQCGTYVPVSSAVKATIGGETLYFCSEECRDRYREAVEKRKRQRYDDRKE